MLSQVRKAGLGKASFQSLQDEGHEPNLSISTLICWEVLEDLSGDHRLRAHSATRMLRPHN
jgi:uncharacterized protein (UPF0147 family)